MKRITIILTTSLLMLGFGAANAQDAQTMAELLQLIQQGQSRDSQEARQREAQFQRAQGQQQNLLNQARGERTRQERESARLEQLFQDQQAEIVLARAALDERLGDLKELFGVLQTVSGDTQGRFNSSLTNLQFPDRESFLVELGSKMASATELASINDIEILWGMLQQEILESGKVVRFNHTVRKADGEEAMCLPSPHHHHRTCIRYISRTLPRSLTNVRKVSGSSRSRRRSARVETSGTPRNDGRS